MDNLSSPVCVKREVSDEDIDVSSFPFLLWVVEVAGGGALFFFPFLTLPLMIQVVQHHPIFLRDDG